MILVGVTLLPIMLLWWRWKGPHEAMSETIDQARR